MKLAFKIFGLVPLALLLAVRDQGFFTLRHPEMDRAQYGAAVDGINRSIHLGLLIVFALVVLQLLWEIGRVILDAYRRREAELR